MTREVRDLLIGMLAAAVLVAFAFVYGTVFVYAIVYATANPDDAEAALQTLNDAELLTIAAGLTGLVGGIVAVALGQQQQEAVDPPNVWRNRLALAYTVVYSILGLGAVGIWVIVASQGVDVPTIIKALASVALGLFLPIVRTYSIPGE